MKIATVIASNGLVAKELLHVAEDTVGHTGNVSAIDFHYGENLEELVARYKSVLQSLDVQNGVLFLIAGEFSCHQYVAGQFVTENKNSEIVTGVNLPMLVSLLLNDEQETDIHTLANKARQYGKAGINIIDVTRKPEEMIEPADIYR